MIKDIVIDTNILQYLENKQYKYHNHCKDCISLVENSEINICIDDGFDPDLTKNKSIIWEEYSRHIDPNSDGYNFFFTMVRADRISIYSKVVKDNRVRKVINTSGIKEKDRVFVRVAFHSKSKLLVSDDGEDFTVTSSKDKRYRKGGRRKMFNDEIGVTIVHSWGVEKNWFDEEKPINGV